MLFLIQDMIIYSGEIKNNGKAADYYFSISLVLLMLKP
jgi:hypothetical protein